MYVARGGGGRVLALRGNWRPGVGARLVVPWGRGLVRGLGACSVLPYDAALSAPYGGAAMCRDAATGAVVPCTSAPCGQGSASAVSQQQQAPAYLSPDATFQLTQVPGFTGDISVPTFESLLQRQLAESEGLPMQNQLAAGAVTVASMVADFWLLKDQYCGLYPAACPSNAAALTQSYADKFKAWSSLRAASVPSGGSPATSSGTAVPPGPGAGGPGASPGSGGGAGGGAGPVPAGGLLVSPAGSPGPAGDGASFLGSSFQVFGVSIPVWGAFLAAGFGVFAFGRSR